MNGLIASIDLIEAIPSNALGDHSFESENLPAQHGRDEPLIVVGRPTIEL